MIEISESNYRRLFEGRNALGAALQHLVNATETSDGSSPGQLGAALDQAQAVLGQYGEHQAFVLL